MISDKPDTTPPVIEARAAHAPTADDPLAPQAIWQRIIAERQPPPLILPPPPVDALHEKPTYPAAALAAALIILTAAALTVWSRLSQ